MRFTKIVIHFPVKARDGTEKMRRAIIEPNNGVDAIFLSVEAAAEFVRRTNKRARLKRPDARHVKVIDGKGKAVPRPATPPSDPGPAGVLPPVDENSDGPGNWYLVETGVECW